MGTSFSPSRLRNDCSGFAGMIFTVVPEAGIGASGRPLAASPTPPWPLPSPWRPTTTWPARGPRATTTWYDLEVNLQTTAVTRQTGTVYAMASGPAAWYVGGLGSTSYVPTPFRYTAS